jgi:hypothetical protein
MKDILQVIGIVVVLGCVELHALEKLVGDAQNQEAAWNRLRRNPNARTFLEWCIAGMTLAEDVVAAEQAAGELGL